MWRRTTSSPLSTATRPGSRRNSSATSASASSQRVWRSSRSAQVLDLALQLGQRAAGDALALALEPDHGHERARVGLGGQAEERRARDLAGVAAPGGVLGLGRAARGGEELLQRQYARRVVEGRQRRRELLAGARGPREGAQGAVDELHAQRRGARERGHRHGGVLDERARRCATPGGPAPRRSGCARSPAGSVRPPPPRGARRPRAGRPPPRSDEARTRSGGAPGSRTGAPMCAAARARRRSARRSASH